MSEFAARHGAIVRAIGSVCDRMISPRLPAGAERDIQARLVGLLLFGPFAAAIAAWMLLPAAVGVGATLGFIGATIVWSWTMALILVTWGSVRMVCGAVLFLAIAQAGILVAAAGGLASVAASLALALPIESWLVHRSKRAAAIGALGSVSALGLSAAIGHSVFPLAAASGWHWVLPIGYLVMVFPRLGIAFGDRAVASPIEAELPAAERSTIALRLSTAGDVLAATAGEGASLGISPDLLDGTGLFDRVHVADRVAYLCAVSDARARGEPRRVELRVRVPSPEGSVTTPRFQAMALDVEPQGNELAAVLRDNGVVADLRATLARALEANDGLEVAKSRFMASVSHELRTPLNSIIGFSEMLLEDVYGQLESPRQRESIQIIREAGSHLLAVVNSILDVSKIESGCYATNPEPFRFDQAVNLCAAMMKPQADAKTITLELAVDHKIGDVHADQRAVRQILINLLSNAIKFTPTGGSVTLGARKVGSHLHFWVKDTGIGIAEADLARLGEPFIQVHNDYTRQYEGTGLGLALVKGLVALHHGAMSMDSVLGEGTTVRISLPLAPPETGVGEPERLPAAVNPPASVELADGTFRKAS